MFLGSAVRRAAYCDHMSRGHLKRGTSDRVDAGRPRPKLIGLADGETDLYEFYTVGGEYVYVHDMECGDIDFRPLTKQLALTFENSRSELMAKLTLALTFDGAEIYQGEVGTRRVGQMASWWLGSGARSVIYP